MSKFQILPQHLQKYINYAQKVRNWCLVEYVFVVTMLLSIYCPLKWGHICKEHAFVGEDFSMTSAAYLRMPNSFFFFSPCQDEILQPVAIPYLHTLGPNSILQRPTEFIRDYLQNLRVKGMEWPTCSHDLKPVEHLWDQFGLIVPE